MKYHGLTIDPGMSSGVCLFTWGDDQPFTPLKLWQFPLGAEGLGMFLDHQNVKASFALDHQSAITSITREAWFGDIKLDALIVEKFTPWNDSRRKEFKLTRDAVEPLRGEGVLIGRGFGPLVQWAEPSMQYFMGSSELPLDQKKELSREFLKLNEFYITGSTVGNKDADDAISAELHAIAWLRRKRHMPTLKALFG